jgi:LysM repeat protein
MRRLKQTLLALTICTLVISCSLTTSSTIMKVQRGMSQEEVSHLLGKPDFRRFDNGSEQWEYTKTNVSTAANTVIIIDFVVRPGDTFKKLSKEFDISQRKLRKYNDLYKGYVLKPGDIIYLDKKHRRADKEHIVHVVRGGESMYSISQKYGIRLKNLYKMNKMKPEDPSPKVGDILRLR